MEIITKFVITFLIVTAFMFLGCNGQEKNTADPIITPKDFDVGLLEILVCPENLTSLHLAKKSEIEKVNKLIRENKLKHWDGSNVKEPMEALFIRKDNKIGYEIKKSVPIMIIEKALVLDESVGLPDPQKHRK